MHVNVVYMNFPTKNLHENFLTKIQHFPDLQYSALYVIVNGNAKNRVLTSGAPIQPKVHLQQNGHANSYQLNVICCFLLHKLESQQHVARFQGLT